MVACTLLGPTTARAQRIEIAVRGGYFLPTAEQFARTISYSGPRGYVFAHSSARLEPGVIFGGAMTVWPFSDIGADFAGTVGLSDRSGTAPDRRAVISTLSVRLVTRRRVSGTTLRFGIGPVLIHMGGAAYGAPNTMDPGKHTQGGATLRGDVTRTVGNLRLQFGLEDLLYRVTLPPAPTGSDVTRTPLQNDVAFTVGVALPVRK